jgi:HTH-type transcriptional regulator, competence development regulator
MKVGRKGDPTTYHVPEEAKRRYQKIPDSVSPVSHPPRQKSALIFGALVRREREAKEIGLREMAKKIGVSPTYQSKVERGELPPPAEDKVRKIAEIIGRNVDELLALAGRVASDLTEIIRQRPREMADFLRAAKGLRRDDLARLARAAQKAKER